MNMNAKQLDKHMNDNGLDRIVVEVVDVNVPNIDHKYYKQKPRVLAKCLVVFSIEAWNENPPRIHYAMYNSFKRSRNYVPDNFLFRVMTDEEAAPILAEYDAHIQGLEQDFRNAFDVAHADIKAKVDEATKLLKEAEALSEQHGVPFRPTKAVSGFKVSYIPKSFAEKFGDDEIVKELAQDLTGAYGSGEYDGWQSSQVC